MNGIRVPLADVILLHKAQQKFLTFWNEYIVAFSIDSLG